MLAAADPRRPLHRTIQQKGKEPSTMKDLHSHQRSRSLIAAQTAAADTTPVAVDRQGYEAVEIVLSIGVGGITFSGTNKIEFVLDAQRRQLDLYEGHRRRHARRFRHLQRHHQGADLGPRRRRACIASAIRATSATSSCSPTSAARMAPARRSGRTRSSAMPRTRRPRTRRNATPFLQPALQRWGAGFFQRRRPCPK
jgi:hypothetical protein